MSENIKQYKSIAFKIVCIWFLLSVQFIPSVSLSEEPRLSIHMYKYSGIHGIKKKQYFNEFKEIIQAKILSISGELGGHDQIYTHLEPFYVKDKNGKHAEFIGSAADLQNRWERSSALEILLGRVREKDNKYLVKSKVFFGDLDTNFDSKFLSIELPIADDQYDTTRDSHSVTILYALALDMRSRCVPENQVLSILSNANEKLQDIPKTHKLLGIEKLRKAVKKALVSNSTCETRQ